MDSDPEFPFPPWTVWTAVVLVAAFVIWNWVSCASSKIGDAVKLQQNGEYAKAYEAYATVLVKAGKTFEAPDPKADLKDWITSITTDYVKYVEEQPHKSDCRAAYAALKHLRDEITALEINYQEKRFPLDEPTFIEFWKTLFYGHQRSMPEQGLKNAKTAFANHLSQVSLKNDIAAPVEVMVYSPNLDRKIVTQLDKLDVPRGVYLESGPWVVVSRLPLNSMENTDKSNLEQKGLEGRYAAYFFELPDESSALRLTLVLNDGKEQ